MNAHALEFDGATPLRIIATLRSEWTKLWAVPSTPVLVIITGVLTMGLTMLVTLFGAAAIAKADGESQYQTIFFGSALGVFAYAFLAAGFMASEYRSGMIAYTLTATSSRARVLLSKLIIVAVLGYGAGLVISLGNLAVTQGGLEAAGLPLLDPLAPQLIRAVVVFTGAGMMVQGLLACMLAALFRNATAAVITLVLVNTLPVVAAQFLGQSYAMNIPRLLPGALLESIAGLSVPGSAGYLPWGWALIGLITWLTAIFTVSLMVMRKRDA